MKILVTGAAGFIGYNFSNFLLQNTKYKIVGVDNLNNYYDVNLKKKRLNILKKFKNFSYLKVDINKNSLIEKVFKRNKFDFVVNLAAQAGVRYSIQEPRKYIESNILGFFNIIENSRKYKIKRLYYASSSSVYGDNKNFPLKEKEKISPKNIYGLSKKNNEQIAKVYFLNYGLKSIGLRFFTVFGEYGRPDMMIMKFLNSFYSEKKFSLFNYGDHFRDFTYIKDVTHILFQLLKKDAKLKSYDIFNICSNSPIDLKKVISIFHSHNIKPQIKSMPLQIADIHKTHGSNKKILKIINFKNFTPFPTALSNTIKWYKDYYNIEK
jgi:UDP-glucuronate 4-epimerase